MQARNPFRVGTSGWSYPHWQGPFYPDELAKSRWFNFYAQTFSTVEVNATFYRFFKDATYLKWRDSAPTKFKYVLKAPRLITHRKYLQHADDQIQTFCRSASLLEDHFGLILLQVAPGTPYDPERLRKALAAFSEPTQVAVEFRHERWLTDETRKLLTELGAIFCIVDSPQMTLNPCWLTSNTAYIRLHGRDTWYAHDYSTRELDEIVSLAQDLTLHGASEVYIFFNNDFNCYAPKNARALMQLLNEVM